MMNELSGYGDVLWAPSSKSCLGSNLTAFSNFIEKTRGQRLETWSELHTWSTHEFEQFWASLAEFYELALVGPSYQDETWFPKASLNFTEVLMKGYLKSDDIDPLTQNAIVSISETGERQCTTWVQLEVSVKAVAHYLKERGIQPGDRVAGVLPNQTDVVVAALATAYIGGVWTSCSPDFGLSALHDRFGQTMPKALFMCDAYLYKGKQIEVSDKLAALVTQIPSIENVIVAPLDRFEKEVLSSCAALGGLALDVVSMQGILKQYQGAKINCIPMNFNDPLYIMYSSGTTGKPKCIIHSVGGTVLQHMKEIGLHTDVKAGESLFYFSTCGWMMWNWLLSGLSVGATLVLFDGNPLYPGADRLIALIEREGVHHFGASAKYYAALSQAGVLGADHNLKSLRSFLSTGSPLLPETFDYIYASLKSNVRVSSISGGTDIISCFALGNPWLPVRRGELQSPGLGMAVQVFNGKGESVIDEKGELVCTVPFPSQPIGFWDDPEKKRYRNAYFSRYNGVWAQGDYAVFTVFGGLVILGRSDAVLNPGGVRIGTAEIYRQVEVIDSVVDCLAVGRQFHDDEQIVLFVQLQADVELTPALVSEIKLQIRKNTSPRHVPTFVFSVPDLPRTRSGKIAEIAVKRLIHGEVVENRDSLANPESLVNFEGLEFNIL